MSLYKDQMKFLTEKVEQILLNDKELNSLKLVINDLSVGKINSKQLRTIIIKSRLDALKQIIEIFTFFYKRIINQQELDSYTQEKSSDPDPQLLHELEEKNTFLQEIGIRINNIVTNLKA